MPIRADRTQDIAITRRLPASSRQAKQRAKILAAQAETSLLHLDEDAVLYATIANQSQTMMARPAVVCTWNGKLVGKTVLTNGLKGLDQQTVAIHISAADLDKVLGEDAKMGAIRLELELIDEAQPLKTACSASYVNITRAAW